MRCLKEDMGILVQNGGKGIKTLALTLNCVRGFGRGKEKGVGKGKVAEGEDVWETPENSGERMKGGPEKMEALVGLLC